MAESERSWGFIGAGQMATALVRGLVSAGVAEPARLSASDPVESARMALASSVGLVAATSNMEVARGHGDLVLAVKPQAMGGVLEELRPVLTERHFVVSIAAGVTLGQLRAGLGAKPRLARVMPNTPALRHAGASAYALGAGATADDEARLVGLLRSVGVALRGPEVQLDAVTGLSGSGPAYVYVMIEALTDGGVRMGLPRDVAGQLAAQTVLGAAKMVLETGVHPGALKDQVASAGGTTIAGLHALERGGVRGALMDAVEAATLRARELAKSP